MALVWVYSLWLALPKCYEMPLLYDIGIWGSQGWKEDLNNQMTPLPLPLSCSNNIPQVPRRDHVFPSTTTTSQSTRTGLSSCSISMTLPITSSQFSAPTLSAISSSGHSTGSGGGSSRASMVRVPDWCRYLQKRTNSRGKNGKTQKINSSNKSTSKSLWKAGISLMEHMPSPAPGATVLLIAAPRRGVPGPISITKGPGTRRLCSVAWVLPALFGTCQLNLSPCQQRGQQGTLDQGAIKHIIPQHDMK